MRSALWMALGYDGSHSQTKDRYKNMIPLTVPVSKITVSAAAFVTAIEITDIGDIPGYGAFGGVVLVAWRILSKTLRDSTDEYKSLTTVYKEEIERLQARVRELEAKEDT